MTTSEVGDFTRDNGRKNFRADIQALRALAVLLVVAYHFWPTRLTGGFVGVDVFFVISGFLITRHLHKEWRETGTISLSAFWARRARRLLPAALLTLVVVAIATWLWLPESQLVQTYREIAASAAYIQNWVLAADSVDYLAAANAASPVQHFWSLSVEEQFYLVWPILALLTVLSLRRRGTRSVNIGLIVAISAISVVSLAISISWTTRVPAEAYFVTPTRAWEFALGALLAFIPALATARDSLRMLIAGCGAAMIVASAILYTSASPFPGTIALLPVVGAALVIWAHVPANALADVIPLRPAVFAGDISYAIYLWHWPVLIFAGLFLELTFVTKVAVIAGVMVISWLSTRFVENRVRTARSLASPARALAIAGVVTLAVAVPAGLMWKATLNDAREAAAQAAAAAETLSTCAGAGYRDPAKDCSAYVPDQLLPAPWAASEDHWERNDECLVTLKQNEFHVCVEGPEDSKVRVAVIGDSHATHWTPAILEVARERDWQVTAILRSSCPHNPVYRHFDDAKVAENCVNWNERVNEYLAEVPPFDLVFVTHSRLGGSLYRDDEAAIEGFRQTWRMFTEQDTQVVVIVDTPRTLEETYQCVIDNAPDTTVCDVDRDIALEGLDRMVAAAEGQPLVEVVDMTDFFCWDGTCKAVIGGVVVYRDDHHITATYSVSLGPYLDEKLVEQGLIPDL